MQLQPRLTRQSLNKPALFLSALLTGMVIPIGLIAQTPAPPNSSPASVPASTEATVASGKQVFEEWIVLFLNGKQCGFGSDITTEIDTAAGPQFHTEHQEEFVVKRLDTDLKMVQESKITEDADGGVLDFEQVTSGFGSNIKSTGVREGDALVVTSRGETRRYHIPRLAALGPDKVRRLTDAMPLKPGQRYSFNTFATDYPQGIVVEKTTIEAQETRVVRGVERKLWRLTSEASTMPGVISTSWVDDHDQDVEALTAIPGLGELHEYVTDRAECMKQPEGAEIFAPTLLRPQRAILAPHYQRQAVYRLTSGDTTTPITLWDQGEQRILSSGNGWCEIEVTAQDIAPEEVAWQLPRADTPDLHSYLQASSYIEVNSPEIQALARQAVGDEKNPVRAAHDIEQFVRAYITKKDLNIGFASAEETARSREGDCTEHSVLCAALGRAVGLPTRCVVGFGYIPPGIDEPAVSNVVDTDTGIFGFHMWAEAWVGPDQWVPMDAALRGFDIGHIAIAKTALEEINPLTDLNMPIMRLMQNLKIEVVKTVPKILPAVSGSAPATPASISTPTSTSAPAPGPGEPGLPSTQTYTKPPLD